MELAVLNTSGSDTGRKVTLPASVFGAEPNEHAVYLVVKQYLANQRQGTHKSKERAEIAGSTKKLKKQKGTGTARAGSIKSPVFRGGGRIFGPKPRDYGFKLNKKVKQLAKRSALSAKATEASIAVVEDFAFDAPKTKDFVSILNNLSLGEKKTLVVLANDDKNIFLSSRNLSKSKVVTIDSLNTYDIIHYDQLVVCEGSVEKFANF
ncbi:50S ribosomal protein L4 [Rapidithrix thailandica]|uniref:Large ribosomal subunit protein uL4 n=1 Tax=Rapidithrix thailandica TaxID=413964 RepID=A0AAW9SBY6_9BACT